MPRTKLGRQKQLEELLNPKPIVIVPKVLETGLLNALQPLYQQIADQQQQLTEQQQQISSLISALQILPERLTRLEQQLATLTTSTQARSVNSQAIVQQIQSEIQVLRELSEQEINEVIDTLNHHTSAVVDAIDQRLPQDEPSTSFFLEQKIKALETTQKDLITSFDKLTDSLQTFLKNEQS